MSLPLSEQFSLVWTGDPALDRERFDAEHAEDVKAERPVAEQRPDFEHRYTVAMQMQDWKPLLKDGATPTVYWFRSLPTTLFNRLMDRQMNNGIEFGNAERAGVALRMALVRVENPRPPLRGIERKKQTDYPGLGEMVTEDCFNCFSKLEVQFLGGTIIQREMSLSPPS